MARRKMRRVAAVTPKAFQRFVMKGWTADTTTAPRNPDELTFAQLKSLFIMGQGSGGECGETAELLKKYVRDGKDPRDDDKLLLELGDQIHYAVRIGVKFGYSFDQILRGNIVKLTARRKDEKK